jgi:hypothetical protein
LGERLAASGIADNAARSCVVPLKATVYLVVRSGSAALKARLLSYRSSRLFARCDHAEPFKPCGREFKEKGNRPRHRARASSSSAACVVIVAIPLPILIDDHGVHGRASDERDEPHSRAIVVCATPIGAGDVSQRLAVVELLSAKPGPTWSSVSESPSRRDEEPRWDSNGYRLNPPPRNVFPRPELPRGTHWSR